MNSFSKLLCRILIAAIPVATGAYSLWYLTSDRHRLAGWYLSLNSHFYRSDSWENSFFTAAVKSEGNVWSLFAFIVSIPLAVMLWRTRFPDFRWSACSRNTIFTMAGISIAGLILSLISCLHAAYANDEVFSALHFAAIPSFQGYSYYILPNNHLLFNLINSFFAWCGDPVQSGRLISALCYIITLNITWYFIKKWTDNVYLTTAIVFCLAIQFSAWGFSAQARGYEMVLMCSILSFVSFFLYYSEKKEYALYLYTTSVTAGMLTIPSFLYWWLGLFIAALILQIRDKKLDKIYLKYTFFAAALCLILSLPVLTFSGASRLLFNGYVQGSNESTWQFMLHFNKDHMLNGLFAEWFCFSRYATFAGALVLSIPVVVFYMKRDQRRFMVAGIIYISLILGFIIITAAIRKFPFHRNLIAHSYMIPMMAMVMIVAIIRSKKIQYIFTFILFAGGAYWAFENYQKTPDNLYYYGVREQYDHLNTCKTDIAPNSYVFLDEDSYYWWYVLRSEYPDKNLRISLPKPLKQQPDYIITAHNSNEPDSLQYTLAETCHDFDLYRKTK